MSTQNSIDQNENFPSRRANDFLVAPNLFCPPGALFDEFWREGELALLFGPPASGKSVLALQLGDGLARGTGMSGFRMPRGRKRVLYVDLSHTHEQFRMRCTMRDERARVTRVHRFPMNLFRDRPPAGQDLCEWLRKVATANKISVAIIDDLSAVRNTHDGTRETLDTMRRLRSLRDELGISILVVADSAEPARGLVGERALGRSRVLCTVADSVFAVGRGLKCPEDHYVVQTRARCARLFWTAGNAPVAHTGRTESGLLVFEFDERFALRQDDRHVDLVRRVARMHRVERRSFREIAAELGISKSWASKVYARWTPALGFGPQRGAGDHDHAAATPEPLGSSVPADQPLDGHEAAADHEVVYKVTGQNLPGEVQDHAASGMWLAKFRPHRKPFAAGLGRRAIRDLERAVDSLGEEVYVESREPDTGRLKIWYKLDRSGQFQRYERGTFHIRVKNLGTSAWVP